MIEEMKERKNPEQETNRTIDVLVAGHVCLDIIPQFSPQKNLSKDYISPGRLINVGQSILATGGPVANTGLSLSRLGAKVELMGMVGDDAFGRELLQALSRENAALSQGMIIKKGGTTSYSIVLSPPGLDRTFLHCPGVNDQFNSTHIRLERVENARIFHFGYPPLMQQMYQNQGSELQLLLQNAQKAGALTSLDTNFPDPDSPGGKADWNAIFTRCLPYVDVFLPSIEEILIMLFPDLYQSLGAEDLLEKISPAILRRLADDLIQRGVKIVVLKLGKKGLYLQTAPLSVLKKLPRGIIDPESWADKKIYEPGFKVKVVGTTGAGDAAIAGFLFALSRNLSPKEALQMAAAVGACNVEAPDAVSGIRSWQETKNRIQQGWIQEENTLCL